MKLLLLYISLIITANVYSQSNDYKKMLGEYYDNFPTITISEALKHVDKKDAIFLDIREKNEFNVSHIKGALQMNPDGSTISKLKGLQKNQLIIVYCSVGARSQTFGKMLKKEGYTNVFNLYGGFFYWANMRYPMVDIKGNKTKRIHGYSPEWGKWVTKGTVVY